jgi:serine protease Do
MRKLHLQHILAVLVVISLLAGLFTPSIAFGDTSTTVVKLWVGSSIMDVGSVRQPIDSEGTKPSIVDGRTLVPIRAVIQAFGGLNGWDAAQRKVIISLNGNTLELWIGKSTASLNGTALPIDSSNPRIVPIIVSGRTMLPLRFVATALGIDVQYDATTRMITLTYTVDTTPTPTPTPTPAPSLPTAPTILSPMNGTTVDSANIVLTWQSVTGADSYRIQVLQNTSEVHAATNLNGTAYTVPAGVLASGTYFWQAAAHNSTGWGAWSDAVSFQVYTKLTVNDIAKFVDRTVLIEVKGVDNDGAFSATGSGFFIGADGRIVTNYHVIDGATQGDVVLNNGQKYDIAAVLGYDKKQDIAVIRVNGSGFPTCTLGDSNKITVGDPVVAIGSPLGAQNTVSNGIISKVWSDGTIQTTAPISPGSSGGALFDMYGNVVGITQAKFVDGENMNLAVPINTLQSLNTTLNLTLDQVHQLEYGSAVVTPSVTLTPPSLIQPKEAYEVWPILDNYQITFTWSPVNGAASYLLWIGSGLSGDDSTKLYGHVTTSTSYTISTNDLLEGKLYTWAVAVMDNNGNYIWSSDNHFSVVSLSGLSTLYPTNYSTISTNPTMTWTPFSGATSYRFVLQQGTTYDSSVQLVNLLVSGTQYTLPAYTLTHGQSYIWIVYALSGSYLIGCSSFQYFTVAP